ncbi:hypothetical protein M9H77_22347 [Catharanthus roseus]|uniref:Uncharacterized protein n=1 Tax=Catharanthus roseus TaxID=4058 RepID=A0ACC0AQ84_CATRO|nr:hypothetical protein M9H77_22347 [Catharanthus roseus]
MDERFHKRIGDVDRCLDRCHDRNDHYEHSYGSKNVYTKHNDSYRYGGYNCRRSSQTLGTTSKLLSYNNLKLPLLRGTLDSYNYVVWEQKVESFFYSYGDCKCENRRRMEAQPIGTWSSMKQALRNRFGVGNHDG